MVVRMDVAVESEARTKRWTSDDVWRMVEVGLLDEDDRYELLDGELLAVSPRGERHAQVVALLNELLTLAYAGSPHMVRSQSPIGGIRDSIPEPDVAVVPRSHLGSPTAPTCSTCVLAVEVAMTSHRRDLRKAQIFAAAGAPEFWLVDVGAGRVSVHREPRPDGSWGNVTTVFPGEQLLPPGVPTTVPVSDVLFDVPVGKG